MRYPGGKGKCFQQIINLMPPHQVYIETHLGGGSVLLHKRPAQRNIAIEVDARVLEAWKAKAEAMGVELIHGRAEDFLASYPFQGGELLYLDPPYHPDTRKRERVYAYDYTVADHEHLLKLLVRLPCMVMLSGYESELYGRVLTNWYKYDFQAKTHSGMRRETLWLNFDPPAALHDTQYLGRNFREREATRRRLERLRSRLQRMDELERAAIARWLHETYPETTRSLT